MHCSAATVKSEILSLRDPFSSSKMQSPTSIYSPHSAVFAWDFVPSSAMEAAATNMKGAGTDCDDYPAESEP